MKKSVLLLCCVVVLGVGSGWAGVTGTTNGGLFNDWANWCQYGCSGSQLATPQNFVTSLGSTGEVGLVGTFQGFYNLQQDTSWFGNFTSGMGLVYNGVAFGNTPTGIAATLDQSTAGVGAYIQADYYGPFTATIELFDSSYQLIGSYTAGGYAQYAPGTALFIGAFSTTPVWAVQFDVTDAYGNEDFALGSMGVSNASPVPEPGTLALLVPSAIGLAGVLRRRFKGVQ